MEWLERKDKPKKNQSLDQSSDTNCMYFCDMIISEARRGIKTSSSPKGVEITWYKKVCNKNVRLLPPLIARETCKIVHA